MITSICDVCKKPTHYRELIDSRTDEFQVTINHTMKLCDMCKSCLNELYASLNQFRAKEDKAHTKRMKAYVHKWIADHSVESPRQPVEGM